MRTTPRIQALRDELIKSMSRPMAKKVLTSLKAILKDAKQRGNVAQNAAADVSITSHGRIKTKPQVGRDIPTRDEIRRIIGAAAPGKGRAFLLTAALTRMRASELRGLRWADVDLNKRQIHVRQRADHWRHIARMEAAMSEGDRKSSVPYWRRDGRLSCQFHAPICPARTGRRWRSR